MNLSRLAGWKKALHQALFPPGPSADCYPSVGSFLTWMCSSGLCWILKGDPLQIFLDLFLCSGLFSFTVFWKSLGTPSSSSSICGVCWASLCSFPCIMAWKCSQSNNLGAVIGFISLVALSQGPLFFLGWCSASWRCNANLGPYTDFIYVHPLGHSYLENPHGNHTAAMLWPCHFGDP